VQDSSAFKGLDARLTRGEILLRASAGLALSSPLLRLLASAKPALAASPASSCALGAFVNPANSQLSFAQAQEATAGLETLIGSRLRLAGTFVAWDEAFPNAGHVLDRDAGRAPLIAWDGDTDLAAIRSGRWDALLRERARACRDFGSAVYLRWAAEFNGAWNPAHGRAQDFVPAWRHIVDTFRAAGATNVRWVWCPFAVDAGDSGRDWSRYYPGARYVDWVGMDGYNWGSTRSWSRWQSFSEIFAPLYADYAGRKPVMICEVGCAERGGDKAAWIRAMGSALQNSFPAVKALVWFDAKKETDWRINSSPASLAAFRSVVAQRYFA
jgi:Glycosyl hydrolase family 26